VVEMSRYSVTEKVWRGVLLMYRTPEIVWYIKDGVRKNDAKDGLLPDNMQQKDLDCVLAALSWARAHRGPTV
jgi:hypothetical protein